MPSARSDLCPSCGSGLTQPLRWSDGAVAFRCPECQSCFRSACTPAELQALEARQLAGRASIVAGYERAVVESMEALVGTLGAAFAHDLLSADDFAPR